MRPNLIVIGAAKCGTTSLHRYLDAHPAIAMSKEKELSFFVEEKNWSRGFAWYEGQFDSNAPVRGESSTTYSAFPLWRGVPERIAQVVPDAKLVYCVRDPIERIVSHYAHRTVNWPEMGTLEETLADAHLREWLVTPSRYWLQLEQYLAHFPADRILVLDSDELRASTQTALARVFDFVGVDPSFRSREFARPHNVAQGRTRQNRVGRTASSLLAVTLGSSRSRRIRERAPQALKSPFRAKLPSPVLTRTLREELEAELRGDVERLRTHTGLAFAGWSI